MSLTKCPECKKEISNSAKVCPNCGYKFSKSNSCLTIIVVSIVVIIIIYLVVSYGGPDNSSSNIINDENTYSMGWREPYGSELVEIGKVLTKHYITGCGEYYVKEVTTDEYLVACTPDGDSWTYYIIWLNIDKINIANDEMKSKLKPPR